MKIIIPVFPQNDIEHRLLWIETDEVPLCIGLAKNIFSYHDLDLLLMTNQKKVWKSAKRIGIDCVFLDYIQEHKNCSLLPYGTQVCLDYLLETEQIGINDPIMVVNYRYPLLSEEILEKAVQSFYQPAGAPVLGVALLRDHPAQMELYFRTLALDTLVLFDSDFDYERDVSGLHLIDESTMVTRSFYLNWLGFGIMGTNKIYKRVLQGKDGCMMVPAKRLEANENNKLGYDTDYFLYEGPTFARRITNIKTSCLTKGNELSGISAFTSPKQSDCLLLSEGSEIHFYINQLFCNDNTELRLWPFSKGKIHTEEIRTVFLGDSLPPNKHQCIETGPKMLGPVIRLGKDMAVDGYVLAILEQCTDEESADFVEPVQLESGCFEVDPLNRQRTNIETGKVITGCQDLPAMYEPNGSVAVLKVKDSIELEESLSLGQTIGLPIDMQMAFRVNSEIDMVKLHCLNKIQKNGKKSW
jgi:hypothetical protein